MSGQGQVMGEGIMDDRVEQLLSGQYFKKYQEAMYSEITEKFNMTLMEVRVLLFFDNHGSSNTAKDLVRIFHYTKSNVSKAIDSLLLRGYLKKQYDDQDRRYIHFDGAAGGSRCAGDGAAVSEGYVSIGFPGNQ